MYHYNIQCEWTIANNIQLIIRGGVEDTRLEAKAKDSLSEDTLSRPRTGMLEAKDQGHSRKCFPKKKVFKKGFQAISNLWA